MFKLFWLLLNTRYDDSDAACKRCSCSAGTTISLQLVPNTPSMLYLKTGMIGQYALKQFQPKMAVHALSKTGFVRSCLRLNNSPASGLQTDVCIFQVHYAEGHATSEDADEARCIGFSDVAVVSLSARFVSTKLAAVY